MIDSLLKLGCGDLDLFKPVAIKESFVSFLVRGIYKFMDVYKQLEKEKANDMIPWHAQSHNCPTQQVILKYPKYVYSPIIPQVINFCDDVQLGQSFVTS